MSSAVDDHPATNITATLINALTQSQTLVRQLEESSRTVDKLRRDNELLRQELEALRQAQPSKEAQEDASEQFDQFFRKDAEKQAEIDELRKQLFALQKKERKWRTQNPQIPSPLVSSDEPESIPSSSPLRSPLFAALHRGPQRASSPLAITTIQQSSSPPHKRLRASSTGDESLQALPNSKEPERKIRRREKDRANRGAEAIPIVTEDGEDHNQDGNGKPKEHQPSEKRDVGAFRRLDALLSTPSRANSLLSKPDQRSSKSASPVAKPNVAPSLRKSSSDLARDAALPPERPRSRCLPPTNRRPPRGPEDDEPLRSRPVSRLNLSHFRLNPNVNNGYDYAYDETVRNKAERKCLPGCTRPECCGGQMEALAATLGPDAKVSDDDLLVYLLGPGSEDKIRTLTTVARGNLLHEARAKRVADAYGKMHRNLHQRAQSPNGFWNVDMPGSQEERTNREESKRRERLEVEKRYREASKEGGKWVFADE